MLFCQFDGYECSCYYYQCTSICVNINTGRILSHCKHVLNFIRNCRTVFCSNYMTLHSDQRCMIYAQVLCHSSQYLGLSCFVLAGFCFFDTESHYVALAGLEISRILGLKMYSTMSSWDCHFKKTIILRVWLAISVMNSSCGCLALQHTGVDERGTHGASQLPEELLALNVW